MKKILALIIIISSTFTFAEDLNCFNFRDESGLKVCVNDSVMVMGTNDAKLLKGPFKVLSVDQEGEVALQYIRLDGSLGFKRKAIAELDIFIMENRNFDLKVKIGDMVIRKSDSKIFEVIGLGSDNSVAIKLGSQLNQWLDFDSYKTL